MSDTSRRAEDFRFVECPRCGNEDFHPEGKFCKRCRAPRTNECADDQCGRGQALDAAYCEWCGHETHHFMLGIIDDWKGPYEKPAPRSMSTFEEDEVPF